jgi:hypothetical protein
MQNTTEQAWPKPEEHKIEFTDCLTAPGQEPRGLCVIGLHWHGEESLNQEPKQCRESVVAHRRPEDT